MTDTFSYAATPDESTTSRFPELGTISPAFLKRWLLVPNREPGPPEYVYVNQRADRCSLGERFKFNHTINEWNWAWESGPFAPATMDPKDMPRALRWLLKMQGRNLRLVTRGVKTRYGAYAPLYHLLPADVLINAGLPLFKRGHWPHFMYQNELEAELPEDFDSRLAQAFSHHMWPLLNGRSARFAFAATDPIRVLSHHLDFWLPYMDVVAQERARAKGRCDPEEADTTYERDVRITNELNANSGAQARRPLRGGPLWMGEDEAWEAAQEVVHVADEHGALRGIIDAIRSHRLQDDFSSVWSFEREDFERKLHRKRSKIRVVFVEMPDSVPVYSEDTEVHERLLWGDFMALLDAKERRVAVCLRRGTIGPVDIANELGYANHSPVSKALARIRRKALDFFEKK